MKIISDLARYLQELLNCNHTPVLWEDSKKLALILRENYAFYQLEIGGVSTLLMVDKKPSEKTPVAIKKQMESVREKCQWGIIYVCEAVSSFNRKRLIDQKIPFIVPGNQMYLPLMGVDFREYFRSISKKKTFVSPSTQAFILYVLYHREIQKFSPKEAAKNMGYSPMTMSRCFDELKSLGVGEHVTQGKDRFLSFHIRGKELWAQVKPFLKSPIKNKITIYGSIPEGGLLAGNSALSFQSMVAESSIPTYAFSADAWRETQKKKSINGSKNIYQETAEIEIWSYNPHLFAKDNKIDPLSLILTMQEDNDERVQDALEKLVAKLQW